MQLLGHVLGGNVLVLYALVFQVAGEGTQEHAPDKGHTVGGAGTREKILVLSTWHSRDPVVPGPPTVSAPLLKKELSCYLV